VRLISLPLRALRYLRILGFFTRTRTFLALFAMGPPFLRSRCAGLERGVTSRAAAASPWPWPFARMTPCANTSCRRVGYLRVML